MPELENQIFPLVGVTPDAVRRVGVRPPSYGELAPRAVGLAMRTEWVLRELHPWRIQVAPRRESWQAKIERQTRHLAQIPLGKDSHVRKGASALGWLGAEGLLSGSPHQEDRHETSSQES